ncbi:MAG: hypothetical protein ABSB40_09775 [Nitrososphaeria archaeon]|jgi:hypothetical protein
MADKQNQLAPFECAIDTCNALKEAYEEAGCPERLKFVAYEKSTDIYSHAPQGSILLDGTAEGFFMEALDWIGRWVGSSKNKV